MWSHLPAMNRTGTSVPGQSALVPPIVRLSAPFMDGSAPPEWSGAPRARSGREGHVSSWRELCRAVTKIPVQKGCSAKGPFRKRCLNTPARLRVRVSPPELFPGQRGECGRRSRSGALWARGRLVFAGSMAETALDSSPARPQPSPVTRNSSTKSRRAAVSSTSAAWPGTVTKDSTIRMTHSPARTTSRSGRISPRSRASSR